jgi:glycerate-2-kinase
VPDTSTFQDARDVLTRYGLWARVPRSIRHHLNEATDAMETPKDLAEVDIHTVMLATNRDACNAAKRRAEALGYEPMVLSTMIEGESREVGTALAGIALEVERTGIPIRPPCVLISGGETTVTVGDECGRGGPNQEFVTSFALKIQGSSQITAAAVGTDGTDGPTDAAGGIVDGYTIQRASQLDIDAFKELRNHNSLHILTQLDDAVYTETTGTNVMDLRVIIVTEKPGEAQRVTIGESGSIGALEGITDRKITIPALRDAPDSPNG